MHDYGLPGTVNGASCTNPFRFDSYLTLHTNPKQKIPPLTNTKRCIVFIFKMKTDFFYIFRIVYVLYH